MSLISRQIESIREPSGSASMGGNAGDRPADARAAVATSAVTPDEIRRVVEEALEGFAARQPVPQPAIEPEAFARMFADSFGAVMSAMIDERLALQSTSVTPRPVGEGPSRAPSGPTRSSFWANVWHADVVLSLLAAAIVLAILIAWSS